jgi:hypothetical protein
MMASRSKWTGNMDLTTEKMNEGIEDDNQDKGFNDTDSLEMNQTARTNAQIVLISEVKEWLANKSLC